MTHNRNSTMDYSKIKVVMKKLKQWPPHLFLFFFFLMLLSLLIARRLEIPSLSSLRPIHSQPRYGDANGTIFCDRTSYHSDLCFMHGDARTHSPSSSVILYSTNAATHRREERIRPYTRKWESIIMDSITELRLRTAGPDDDGRQCDVRHDVPALFFSAGGYTGNLFHAFNNGILPLYITSQHLNRRVVLVVLKYRHWWYTKYQEILSQLSDFPVIDFSNDTRTHCFPEAIVGLRFHGTLAVDPARIHGHKTIGDFHQLLNKAYSKPGIMRSNNKPRLIIVSRDRTRAIENEGELVQLAMEVGFEVEVLRPEKTMAMARIYHALNSCDVMIGVHGAALTHFLFMRPRAAFIQIVPLGLDGVAESCYGEPAAAMGLRYEEYKILQRESSLYGKYEESSAVLQDPKSVLAKGWEVTKEVYLEDQNVTLDMSRVREPLARALQYVLSKREGDRL